MKTKIETMKDLGILKYVVYVFTCLLTIYNIITIKTKTELDSFGNELNHLVPDSIVYGGFGLVLVFVFIILKSDHWKRAFAIVLVAAVFCLVKFSSRTFTLMGVEITCVFLLVLHIGFNPDLFNPLKKGLKKALVLKEGSEEMNESLIENYEIKYAKKTIEQLNHIAKSSEYSAEAVEAAFRLIARAKKI